MPPKKRSLIWAGIVLLLLIVAPGCAKRKATSKTSEPASPNLMPGEAASLPALFPHPENWSSPASHGTSATERGVASCLPCHASEDSKKTGAPACQGCHPLFPHQQGWIEKGSHGGHVVEKGRRECATTCHGADFKGGLSQVSCVQCHATYPHPDNWKEIGEHGATALGEGKKLCQNCHGVDFRGGERAANCYSCHELYPHSDTWARPDRHGDKVLKDGKAGCATGCHGNDLAGGASKISCDSCHLVYPHKENWSEGHKAVAREYGNDLCQRCHGEDFSRLLNQRNCFSCHEDYPHPARDEWLPFQGGHGERVQQRRQGSTETCQRCHGESGERLVNGENCSSCHPPYPFLHRGREGAAWRDFEQHGEYTFSHSTAECTLCHGRELAGGIRTNSSCYSCHRAYPHPTGWMNRDGGPQGHTLYVRDFGQEGCATSHCHGEGLIPAGGVTRGPSCNGCHANLHPANWAERNRHGSQVLAEGYADCLNCHQADRSGYAAARSCLDCHAGFYPHGLIPNWETTGHGQTALNSANRRVCGERCHGESLTGNEAAPSCYSCHTEFPHSSRSDEWVGERQVVEQLCRPCEEGDEDFCDGNGNICWDSSIIHMSRHGESFLAQKDAGFPDSPNRCSVCHGSNYQGGASGVSCGGTCHSGFSEHLSDPDWSNSDGGSHGTAYRTGPAGAASSCVVCHLNFDRGRDARAPACASCHINYPHLSDWLSARRHGFGFIINEWLDDGTEARQNACASCHGDNFRGAGDPVKDCASCHEHYGAVSHLGCCERSGRWASTAHPNARQAILDGDTDRCTQCHGTTPVEPRFLSAFCTTCHQRR